MKISREKLKEYIRNFLGVIDREGISSLSDLEKRVNEIILITTEPDGGCLSIDLRPSDLGTKTHTISYIPSNIGIPLEVRINKDLIYSVITIKSIYEFPGYKTFGMDVYDNRDQEKRIPSIDFSQVRQELESLLK